MFEPKRQLLVEPGGLVMTGFGASFHFPLAPAEVGLPKGERLLSIVGGNASSCPEQSFAARLRVGLMGQFQVR
jgi:hypothetical protein